MGRGGGTLQEKNKRSWGNKKNWATMVSRRVDYNCNMEKKRNNNNSNIYLLITCSNSTFFLAASLRTVGWDGLRWDVVLRWKVCKAQISLKSDKGQFHDSGQRTLTVRDYAVNYNFFYKVNSTRRTSKERFRFKLESRCENSVFALATQLLPFRCREE